MATNPNRPQYQDTVESTWGQSVADHVIRRYATAAQRDADLAGLTLADLTGQVVAVGSVPELQMHDGARWLPIQAGVPNDEANAPIGMHLLSGWRGGVANGAGVVQVVLPPGGRLVSGMAINRMVNVNMHFVRDKGTAQGGPACNFQALDCAGGGPIANVLVEWEYSIWFTNDPAWVPTSVFDDEPLADDEATHSETDERGQQ